MFLFGPAFLSYFNQQWWYNNDLLQNILFKIYNPFKCSVFQEYSIYNIFRIKCKHRKKPFFPIFVVVAKDPILIYYSLVSSISSSRSCLILLINTIILLTIDLINYLE